jgi:hypothetical protein
MHYQLAQDSLKYVIRIFPRFILLRKAVVGMERIEQFQRCYMSTSVDEFGC